MSTGVNELVAQQQTTFDTILWTELVIVFNPADNRSFQLTDSFLIRQKYNNESFGPTKQNPWPFGVSLNTKSSLTEQSFRYFWKSKMTSQFYAIFASQCFMFSQKHICLSNKN